jgi:hypothetical protein
VTAKRKGKTVKPVPISKPNTFNNFLAKEPKKVWMIAVGIAVLFCALTFNPHLGIQGDNADYIILAQSVYKGPFMHSLNFPTPRPSQTLPAGLPLLLAPVALITGTSLMALKLWITILFLLSLPLLYYWLRSVTTPTVAALVVVLVGINPFLLEYSHITMSEIPFWTVAIAGLFLLYIADKKAGVWNNPWMWGGLILIGYLYWIRSAGVAAIVAVGLHYLIRKQWKQLIMAVVVIGAVALPWMLISRGLGGTKYFAQFMSVNPYRPEMGLIGVSGLLGRMGRNFVTYIGWELPRGILPILHEARGATGFQIWGWLVSAVWLCGFIPFLIKYRERVGLYVLMMFGTCLVWPEVWSDLRFALGILPLVIFFAVEGVRNLVRWFPKVVTPAFHTPLGLVLVTLLVISCFSKDVALATTEKQYAPNWKDFFAAGTWIKSNTPSDAVVACRKPHLIYLTTGRKTTYFASNSDPSEVLKQMEAEGVGYVIYDMLGFSDTPRFLKPTIEKYKDRFQLVWKGNFTQTYLFKLVIPEKTE